MKYSELNKIKITKNVMLFTQVFFLYLIFSDIPKVRLEFGKNLDTENIKEGDDAYFECHVQARPEITKIQWIHNVSISLLC